MSPDTTLEFIFSRVATKPVIPNQRSRRQWLGTLAGAATLGTAGCVGSGGLGDVVPGGGGRTWPMYGYDAADSQVVTEWDAPDSAPSPTWRTDLGTQLVGPPLLADGTAIVEGINATGPSKLAGVDAASGEIQWKIDASNLDYAGGGIATADALYLAGGGTLQTLDPASGEQLWSSSMEGTAVRYADGRLYAVGPGASVTVFDVDSRETVWEAAADADYQKARQVAVDTDGRVYVADHERRFYAFERGTEGPVWTTEETYTSPDVWGLSVVDGSLFVQYDDDKNNQLIESFDADTGESRWSHEAQVKPSIPTVAGGRVYYTIRAEPGIVALDAETGTRLADWSGDIGTSAERRPMVVGDTLMAAGYDSTTAAFALDPATGARRWRAGLKWKGGQAVVTPDRIVYSTAYELAAAE